MTAWPCELYSKLLNSLQVWSTLEGFTLRFWEFSYVVKAQSNEQAPTGSREVAVLQALLGSGKLAMNESGNVEGWAHDPYDASATASLMRNIAEDESYDEQYPDHPLSRLRRILAQIQNSLRISSEVKAQPRSVQRSSLKKRWPRRRSHTLP